jgi:hypothetical protein
VGKVYRWLRDKFVGSPVAAASLDQAAAQPGDAGSREMLELALAQRLKAEPGLADELFALLPPEVQQSVTQTASASGGAAVAQVAGHGNTTHDSTGGKS